MRTTTTLTIAFLLISTPLTSRADEGCATWFDCEEAKPETPKPGPDSTSKLKGQDVSVVLTDGTVVRGVIVEVALDHLTIAAGATKVTFAWAEVVGIRVNPATPAPAPAPTTPPPNAPPPAAPAKDDSPYDATEEAQVDDLAVKPSKTQEPYVPDLVVVEPKPPLGPGLFAIGARAKLVGVVDGSRFAKGSAAMSDYVAGGVAYEVSFAIRLTRALMLRAAYEHADLIRGDRNFASESPSSEGMRIGVRWLFGSAADVHGIFEAGIGYRWLSVPYADGAAPDGAPRRPGNGVVRYEGAEVVRLALGSAFTTDDHSRVEVLVEGSYGRFSAAHDDNMKAGPTRMLSDSQTSAHGFLGIAIGLELGP
jgi:hypothetical protein